jgi:hypothetical protein
VKREVVAARFLFVYAAVFGSSSWLLAVPRLARRDWIVSDVGVWWSGWRLVISGHFDRIYDYPLLQQVFKSAGLTGHADLNAWVLPPQHALMFSPLALMEPRLLYAVILGSNIAAWWWLLQSLAEFAAKTAANFWTPERIRIMKCAGWLFGPASLSGLYGAFPCLIVAATWKIVRDSMRADSAGIATAGTQVPSLHRFNNRWTNAVLLVCASAKPQMILLVCVSLVFHSRFGRGVVVRAAGMIIASSAAIFAVNGSGQFRDWARLLSEVNAGRLGTPRHLWWSPIPILTDTLAVTTTPFALTVAILFCSIAAVAGARRLRAYFCGVTGQNPLLVAAVLALTLTYAMATYQSMYDSVVLFPAVILALTMHATRQTKQSTANLAMIAVVATAPLNSMLRLVPLFHQRETAMLSLLILSGVALVGSFQPSLRKAAV